MEQGLCGLLASALRQLPCRRRPSALVRRPLRGHPGARLQCPAGRRRQWLRQSRPALHELSFLQQFQRVAWTAGSRELAPGAGRDGVVANVVGRNLRADQGSRRAPADARSRRSPRMCATTSWSAGAGIPAPAASPLPARPSRPTARSRTGPRPGRLVRPIDPAMNFCDYFASCCCCRTRNLLTRPCARVEDGFAHAHIRGCAGNQSGVEPAPRIG